MLEAVVLLAAPPQPVSTPAHRARAVRAAAVLRMLRFFILFSFPDVGKIRHRTEGYRKENLQKNGAFRLRNGKAKRPRILQAFWYNQFLVIWGGKAPVPTAGRFPD